MSGQLDLQGFVEAAVFATFVFFRCPILIAYHSFEDAELTQPDNEEEVEAALAAGQIPRWAQARQRYTKRQMAYISPRLGLLNNLPMAVPFQTRVEVFRQFVEYALTTFKGISALTQPSVLICTSCGGLIDQDIGRLFTALHWRKTVFGS